MLVHDGGPRISQNGAEAVWVSVRGVDGDVFRGRVLNQPHDLHSVSQGSEIQFIAAEGADFPIMVTERYLLERPNWDILPCRKCGFSELFDAPSDLMRAVFPNIPADAAMTSFTAFCPLCGGVQLVKSQSMPDSSDEPAPAPPAAKRPWWQFWG